MNHENKPETFRQRRCMVYHRSLLSGTGGSGIDGTTVLIAIASPLVILVCCLGIAVRKMCCD